MTPRLKHLCGAMAIAAIFMPLGATAASRLPAPAGSRAVSPPVNRHSCPTTVEALTVLLLRDLPGYGNRLAQRQKRSGSELYLIAASGADFTPLPVKSSEYPDSQDQNLHQVFFTTLERDYHQKQMRQWQQHHWLFLAQTAQGWRLALLYSRLAPYPPDLTRPPLPPRDSSQGLTAEAMRLWLRDCQAGAVPP